MRILLTLTPPLRVRLQVKFADVSSVTVQLKFQLVLVLFRALSGDGLVRMGEVGDIESVFPMERVKLVGVQLRFPALSKTRQPQV